MRVEAAMLRGLLPNLVLREGMGVIVSVTERAGQKGIIMLAGVPLAAQLPDEVQAGDVLRLIVTEAGGERIVLRIADTQDAPPATPPGVPVPLPEGMNARIAVAERDESSSGGRDPDQHEVRLTYASARLGAIELHLALAGGEALRINVRARVGGPFELAQRHAAELQDAVGAATGKATQVLVSPRHDPLDVYA
ncbi:MAG: hypothetical protein QOH83_524 [Solirubrobacteraceae bacterium]|nr:hypothetical protein [Solirubrobacteraceae bacterium]